jgi:hypothetical protein
MDSEFLTRIVTAFSKFANNVDIQQSGSSIKLVCECIYCGRSKRNFPHMGVVIELESNGQITGGANCFRCGTSKSLKSFLYDLREILSFYGITAADIEKNVIVKESKEKVLKLDFKAITRNAFFEQAKFYSWMQSKYGADKADLRKRIFLNMNGFMFLKKRLKLNFKPSIYDAYRILKEVKGRVYLNQTNRFVLMFDEKIRYVFDPCDPELIRFDDDRDIELFGEETFPFVFKSYTKLKNAPKEDNKYYIIKDTNCGDCETYDIQNVFVAEGVFDALTMKFYKNIFNLSQINRIEENIFNLYVAMAHSRIDKFVSEYFLGVTKNSDNIVNGIKELNFIMIPDLNMNVKRYIFSLYNFIQKNYTGIRLKMNTLKVQIFYLDLFNAVGDCATEVKDVNDMIGQLKKRALRNIGLTKIL